MAGRKGVVVTEPVNSSEELYEFLSHDGLCVLDAFQTWCGPCKPVQARLIVSYTVLEIPCQNSIFSKKQAINLIFFLSENLPLWSA